MTPTLDLDKLVLLKGAHEPNTDLEMCLMEAVAYIAGEEWSDHPECASPVVGAFLRTWQDQLGDDPRQDLKRYIPRLVGSRGSQAQEDRRAWLAMDWLVRVYTPAWLRCAGLNDQAALLEGCAELAPDTTPTIRPVINAVRKDAAAAGDAARNAARDAARAAARDAAGDAAWDAAWDAARAAAWAAAWDAAWAAGAARDAAWAAAWAAARDAAWAAAWDAAWAAGAARDAAWAAVQPTVTELQAAAHDLVDRMLAVTGS